VILTEQETARLHRFIRRVGAVGRAMKLLGLGEYTFDAARGYGRMRSATRERVLDALTRAEIALDEVELVAVTKSSRQQTRQDGEGTCTSHE
jgi:hypothetical protein